MAFDSMTNPSYKAIWLLTPTFSDIHVGGFMFGTLICR